MKWLKLLIPLLALPACETSLRAPMCQDSEFEFPAGAEGRYRFSTLTASAAQSGAYTSLQTLDFIIRETPGSIDIETDAQGNKVVEKLFREKGVSLRDQEAKVSTIVAGDEPDPVAWMPLVVCRIGDRYYTQAEGDDGSYTIQRFDLSSTGITTTYMAWRPEDLTSHAFPFYFMPKFEGFSGGFDFDMVEPTRLIVDNRSLSDERRELLVSLANPTVLGMVFSKVGPLPASAQAESKAGKVFRYRIAKR